MSNFVGQASGQLAGNKLSPRLMSEQQTQIGKPSEIERLLTDMFAATDRIESQVEILLRRLDVVTSPRTKDTQIGSVSPPIAASTQLGERIAIIVSRLSDVSQRLVEQNDSLAL